MAMKVFKVRLGDVGYNVKAGNGKAACRMVGDGAVLVRVSYISVKEFNEFSELKENPKRRVVKSCSII